MIVIAWMLMAAQPRLVVEVSGAPALRAPPDDATLSDAQALYAGRCAFCHGPRGEGDGPGASTFPKKPRKFTDVKWQAATTDDAITHAILEGGSSNKKLSALMPANPDLKEKPALVAALVSVVRAFGPKPGVHVRLKRRGWKADLDAVAAADGTARVDAGLVAPGTYTIVVERAPGMVLCKTTAVVTDVDVTATCAPAR